MTQHEKLPEEQATHIHDQRDLFDLVLPGIWHETDAPEHSITYRKDRSQSFAIFRVHTYAIDPPSDDERDVLASTQLSDEYIMLRKKLPNAKWSKIYGIAPGSQSTFSRLKYITFENAGDVRCGVLAAAMGRETGLMVQLFFAEEPPYLELTCNLLTNYTRVY